MIIKVIFDLILIFNFLNLKVVFGNEIRHASIISDETDKTQLSIFGLKQRHDIILYQKLKESHVLIENKSESTNNIIFECCGM
jgi:hypothetical protein